MPPTRRKTYTDGSRVYEWKGESFWSVTTILANGVPKPNLVKWGIREVAEGAVGLGDTLPALIKKDKDAAISMLKNLPYAKRERAARLGSAVHDAIEAYVLGQAPPSLEAYPEEVRAHMGHFQAFLQDFRPVFEMAEAAVYNRSERYAGTLDGIAWFPSLRRNLILDTKTGKDIYPEVALQMSAYRHAEFRGLPDGSEAPMPQVQGAVALHLTARGYRLIPVRTNREVFRAFLYAREVFRWVEETSHASIGPPLVAPTWEDQDAGSGNRGTTQDAGGGADPTGGSGPNGQRNEAA